MKLDPRHRLQLDLAILSTWNWDNSSYMNPIYLD